ncbi:metal ABC transporter solute-binding protein, Zn/Mn family [Pseudochelatococcus sp. G4_1912]|uniref:metal ABC transporter solute-binding protein, Zn/Mn family n=1 Tax=Pseudochelatococcus sp. G4_1912 TaxID=3114288 RepID=UPI0039C653A7
MVDQAKQAVLSRRAVLAGAAALLSVGLGGHRGRAMAATNPLRVVTTTGILADALSQVGGRHVTVQALMGPGVDPHLHRQTSSDVAAATGADIVFWHGLHLETQLQPFFAQLGRRKPVIALGDALPRARLLRDEDDDTLPDPHVWFDPHLWAGVVRAACNGLSAVRPEAAADFEENTARHLEDIAGIAKYANAVLTSVPVQSRILVTAHDAFNYFGRAYGYEVCGVQGVSTESEAGLRQIEKLVSLLVERRIGAIFVESSVSERNVSALIEGAEMRGHKVIIGGALYSDAAGEAGTYEGTYIGMIDHNATVIARALGGTAPMNGLAGKLTMAHG